MWQVVFRQLLTWQAVCRKPLAWHAVSRKLLTWRVVFWKPLTWHAACSNMLASTSTTVQQHVAILYVSSTVMECSIIRFQTWKGGGE